MGLEPRNQSITTIRHYLADFNLDAYYGVQADWQIGKKFILNTGLRFNTTIEKNSQDYKKANPVLVSIGTGF